MPSPMISVVVLTSLVLACGEKPDQSTLPKRPVGAVATIARAGLVLESALANGLKLGMPRTAAVSLFNGRLLKVVAGVTVMIAGPHSGETVTSILYVDLPGEGVVEQLTDAWGKPSERTLRHGEQGYDWVDTSKALRATFWVSKRTQKGMLKFQTH